MAAAEEIVELVKLVGGPSAVIALGWWLRGKFFDVATSQTVALESHEKQDERRHRQNLVRFAKINVKLGIGDANETNGDDE